MADNDDRSTRDLVIGLTRDVAHLQSQLTAVLKLEDRILACEAKASEAKDFASRLLWAALGAGALVISIGIPVALKAVAR